MAFERELQSRILQAIPHASIQGNILKSEVDEIGNSLKLNPSVLGFAPYIETQGLLSSGSYLKEFIYMALNQTMKRPFHQYKIISLKDL